MNYDEWKEKGMDDGLDEQRRCGPCEAGQHDQCESTDCDCDCTLDSDEIRSENDPSD